MKSFSSVQLLKVMAENDDEWATVSTVEDDVVDNSSNNNGPSGINDPSLFNKSRFIISPQHNKLYILL